MASLESLLKELANLTEEAHEQHNTKREQEDEDWEVNEDEDPWFSLEHLPYTNTWRCGYRVRPDEATEWTFYGEGSTPLLAAQELQKLIK